jgi:hypothetical protein
MKPPAEPECPGHEFLFLRQEKQNVGYDRNPEWIVEDVFHCKHCLTYRRVPVERQTERHDGSGVYSYRLV